MSNNTDRRLSFLHEGEAIASISYDLATEVSEAVDWAMQQGLTINSQETVQQENKAEV